MSDKPKTKKKTTPPNVQFVGRVEQLNKKTGRLEKIPREAPPGINDGETQIKLPSSVMQKKGFYSKDAARLMALFPDDYKIPTEKGVKQ